MHSRIPFSYWPIRRRQRRSLRIHTTNAAATTPTHEIMDYIYYKWNDCPPFWNLAKHPQQTSFLLLKRCAQSTQCVLLNVLAFIHICMCVYALYIDKGPRAIRNNIQTRTHHNTHHITAYIASRQLHTHRLPIYPYSF